ncbi:MAG: hypothetical protein ACYDC5_08905 [Candidatus Dormibacteria bacterium]
MESPAIRRRETRRTNSDGGTVSYTQLAHSRRGPRTSASPRPRSFTASAAQNPVDREGLAPLVRSISRFLEPAAAVAATTTNDVAIVDSRPMGGALVLDQLWHQLGIDQSLKSLLAGIRLEPKVERWS